MVWPRRLILFAFWTVVVAIGVPHWIYTTSIHRSSLPLEVMDRWAEGNVRCHSLSIDPVGNADTFVRLANFITRCSSSFIQIQTSSKLKILLLKSRGY